MPKFFTKEQITSIANQIKTYMDTKFGKAVLFTPQTLADNEKAQARTNINTDKPSENKTISGDIASFADGSSTPVKDLKATLDVVQPLHGYSNPWPAGGGKNLLSTESMVAWNNMDGLTITKNSDGSFVLNGTATATAYQTIPLTLNAGTYTLSGCPAGGSTGSYSIYISGGINKFDTGNGVEFTLTQTTTISVILPRIVSGTVCNNLTFKPMICLSSAADPTTFAPYSNICPIYPVTEVEVSRAGVNIWDKTYIENKGLIATNGQEYNWTGGVATNWISVKGGASYYFNVKELGSTGLGLAWYDKNRAYISGYNFARAASYTVGVQTAPTNACFVRFCMAASNINTASLNYPSTATAYEAYKGTQYLVNIGINQWDEVWENGYISDSDGTNVGSATQYLRAKNYIPVIAGQQYYWIASLHSGKVYYYTADKTYISYDGVTGSGQTITPPSGCAYMRFWCNYTGGIYAYDISINYPSRFTSYYPYTGRQVYGGELDVTTGVLTARYKMVEAKNLYWAFASASNNYYAYTPTITDHLKGAPGIAALRSNICANSNTSGQLISVTISGGGGGYLQINLMADFGITTQEQFNTWVASSGMTYLYALATPLTIQLTPTEVQTLTGTNNVWADSGAVNVSYWTEGLVEADNLNAVLDSKKVVYASPHTYSKEDALQARLNIGARSNRNLLDNPFFSVNQRGLTTYSSRGYTVDRWIELATGANVTVSDDGVTLAPDTSMGFHQWFDDSFIKGKTVTLSILYQDGRMSAKTFVWPTSGSAFYGDGIAMNVYYGTVYQAHHGIALIHGTTVSIRAIKLELGPVSTLSNDVPPCYAEELAKCQRYFVSIGDGTNARYLGSGCINGGGTAANILVPLPVTMRAKPTVTYTGQLILRYGAQVYGSAIGNVDYVDANGVGLTITCTATAFNAAFLYTTGKITFSADL